MSRRPEHEHAERGASVVLQHHPLVGWRWTRYSNGRPVAIAPRGYVDQRGAIRSLELTTGGRLVANVRGKRNALIGGILQSPAGDVVVRVLR